MNEATKRDRRATEPRPEEIKATPESSYGARAEPSTSVEASHASAPSDEAALPALARAAVEAYVRHGLAPDPASVRPSPLLSEPAACFVSIKTTDGHLRGCIGTIEPSRRTLAEELIANAVSAAMNDPRFYPVREEELPFLRYSVDVLMPPEPARFEDLDPSVFGVIVEDERRSRRGLLLPSIEGVETASEQVDIAARKAGIRPGTPLRFYRFRVRRFREPASLEQTNEQGANL